jgi:hypothetical protein
MGLTPTGGVIMGTRCGDLDPGVLVYLVREKKFDADLLEELVDRRSVRFTPRSSISWRCLCVSSGKSEHYRSFKRCIFFLHIEVRIRYAQPRSRVFAA